MLHIGTTDPGYVSLFRRVGDLVRMSLGSGTNRHFNSLDDRMLDDIGLRRTDLGGAADLPMQMNAPMPSAERRGQRTGPGRP